MRIKKGVSKLEEEKNISDSEVIGWKMYLKQLFITEIIDEDELQFMYNLPFMIDKLEEDRHIEIFNLIMDMATEDVKKDLNSSIINMIKEDIAFILDGSIKEDFERDWIFYLHECLNDGSINDEQYDVYRESIDFTTPLSEDDKSIINEILNLLRIKIVKRNPDIISELETPTFDMLMIANDIEI